MTGNMPELPSSIYIDQRTFSIYHEPGEFRVRYIMARSQREKKDHPHYKTDGDVEMMKSLAKSGMTQKQIAQELGFQTRTVRKFLGPVFDKKKAGQFEIKVKNALVGVECSCRQLSEKISNEIGRDVSIAQLDLTLRKLEKKGEVKFYLQRPEPRQGGRGKKIWSLTEWAVLK